MKTLSKKLPSLVAVLGIAAGLAPRLSARQSVPPIVATYTIRSGVPASDSELTPEVRALVTRGDAFTGARRYAAAEREYRHAAEIVRQQGHLPSYTLWHLACALYYEGELQRAATILEQLTSEAEQSGDIAVEALALYNSAWLNGRSGSGRLGGTKLERVRNLLRSPYMPSAVRNQLDAMLAQPGDVAVKP
jgi:HEAT repeat protein